LRVEAERRRWRSALAAAAVLAVCAAAALWLKSAYDRQSARRSLELQATPTMQTAPEQLATATLVLETPTVIRSGDGADPLRQLPRSRLTLVVYFPLHSEPGSYEVQFLKSRTDLVPLLRFEGHAQLANRLPVLRVTVDLSGLARGTYVVRFRRAGGSWQYCRVVLS